MMTAYVCMNVVFKQMKNIFVGFQEKLESVLGGVGWKQSGFLQRS